MTTLPATAPFDLAAPWGGRSHVLDLDGPVHWVDFGGPDAPAGRPEPAPVVLVHGLGGSHLNWVGIAGALARTRRVVALDLPGFGLSPAEGRATTVHHNAAVLSRFVHEVLGRPVVLVGNSMGGMVSLLLAGRRPEQVVGLALVDPSLPTPGQRPDPQVAVAFGLYAVPRVGERFLRRLNTRYSDRERVLGTVDLCFADPTRADPAVIDAGVELAAWRRRQGGQETEFLGAARSILAMLRRPRRYDAVIGAVRQPVLLLHGTRDRFVPVGAARRTARLNPSWHTAYLEGRGHTPQLEAPEEVLGHLEPWLGTLA